MKLKSLTIENIKSFRERALISLAEDLNVFVGPNAGGKSNLLDIMTVILRGLFLQGYLISEGSDASGMFRSIGENPIFHPLSNYLDKFVGNTGSSLLTVEVVVTREDVENIKFIRENRASLEAELLTYRSKPYSDLRMLDGWDPSLLSVGHVLKYSFIDGNPQSLESSSPEALFKAYLFHFELFWILAGNLETTPLKPPALYFPPYRSVTPQDLVGNLSSESYYELLRTYYQSTSRGSTSLLKIATHYFAQKKRRLELTATTGGYSDKWENDPEVQLVTRYLQTLGYSWDLRVLDERRNIYQIQLAHGSEQFQVSQASSGEKEIINFLLGIFSFNITNGVILVDEPELHLHPKWQGLLRELFQELATTTGNQFILTTHSPIFIHPSTIHRVQRVYRDGTATTRLQPASKPELKDMLHIINSHNNERMFFADKVVLVEGIKDRLFWTKILDDLQNRFDATSVIEVLEVNGKSNFKKYRDFLTDLTVDNYIVADLDFVHTTGDDKIKSLFTVDFHKIQSNVVDNKKSEDGRVLAELLDEAIAKTDLSKVSGIWSHIKTRHFRLREHMEPEELAILDEFIAEQSRNKTFILRQGEIEDYLPPEFRTLESLIRLTREKDFWAWLKSNCEVSKRSELESIGHHILGLGDPVRSLR